MLTMTAVSLSPIPEYSKVLSTLHPKQTSLAMDSSLQFVAGDGEWGEDHSQAYFFVFFVGGLFSDIILPS